MATDLGKGGRNKPNARARAAALREQQRKREARRRLLTIGGIGVLVVAVIVAMVLVYALKGDKKNAALRQPAPASVVQQVTSVSQAAFTRVGVGDLLVPPSKISGPPLVYDGKPGLLFYGAEYCPFCAAERWPFVVALSRFGTWSNLQATTSSSQDQFPNTPTFSLYGAKYSSPYLTLQAVETQTNQLKNGNYGILETPTAEQSALVSKYDNRGSIPFIDFGNKFAISGASYDNTVLQGKSMDEIAAAVGDGASGISKGVLGTANTMTAAICEMTGGKPGAVCNAPEVSKLRTQLNALKK